MNVIVEKMTGIVGVDVVAGNSISVAEGIDSIDGKTVDVASPLWLQLLMSTHIRQNRNAFFMSACSGSHPRC